MSNITNTMNGLDKKISDMADFQHTVPKLIQLAVEEAVSNVVSENKSLGLIVDDLRQSITDCATSTLDLRTIIKNSCSTLRKEFTDKFEEQEKEIDGLKKSMISLKNDYDKKIQSLNDKILNQDKKYSSRSDELEAKINSLVTSDTSQDHATSPTKVVNIDRVCDVNTWYERSNTLYIGRKNSRYGLPRSKWANPWIVGEDYTLTESLESYEKYIRSSDLYQSLHEIDNKELGCFCHPARCHGDILLKLRAQQKESVSVGSTANNPTSSNFVSDTPVPVSVPDTPVPDSNSDTVSGHIAVIMDSNRRHLDFNKLFPNDRVKVYPCGTISYALRKLPSLGFPKTVVVHLGTNDIEKVSPQQVHDNLVKLKGEIESRYNCRTIVSNLLPRSDVFSHSVGICNDLLSSSLRGALISHHNISQQHLHDKKHVSFRNSAPHVPSGCQLLSSNMFSGVYGYSPPNVPLQNVNTSRYQHSNTLISPPRQLRQRAPDYNSYTTHRQFPQSSVV